MYTVKCRIFLFQFINTCFAALLLPQVKLNTTDYADLHKLSFTAVFQSMVICIICGKKF